MSTKPVEPAALTGRHTVESTGRFVAKNFVRAIKKMSTKPVEPAALTGRHTVESTGRFVSCFNNYLNKFRFCDVDNIYCPSLPASVDVMFRGCFGRGGLCFTQRFLP